VQCGHSTTLLLAQALVFVILRIKWQRCRANGHIRTKREFHDTENAASFSDFLSFYFRVLHNIGVA
jgi:hypothetical protein